MKMCSVVYMIDERNVEQVYAEVKELLKRHGVKETQIRPFVKEAKGW